MKASFEAVWRVTVAIGKQQHAFLIPVERMADAVKLFRDIAAELERLMPAPEEKTA